MPPTNELATNPEAQQSIESSLALLQNPAFQEGFVAVQTAEAREAADQIAAAARSEASKLARGEIEDFAAAQLGVSVEEGRQKGKEWGLAVKQAGAAVSEATGGATLQEHLAAEHLTAIESDPVHQAKATEIQQQLVDAEAAAVAEGAAMIADIESRKDDPGFLEATSVWANSPDSQGDVGENGLGYNAGVVHFFEYRGDAKKSSRFKVMDEPASVDGFIDYSGKLKADLEAVGSSTDGRQEAVLQDSEGNQRVYILKPDGELVVAFQKAGDTEPKVTSVIPRQKGKDFEKTVAASLSGHDRGKLNKLGETVQRLL